MIPHIQHCARFLRTVRHLRCTQIAHRGRRLIPRHLELLSGRKSPPPGFAFDGDFADGFPFIPLAGGATIDEERLVERLEQGVFEHLNQSRCVGLDKIDWRLGQQKTDRLWSVTLHYHRWAYELARVTRRGNQLASRAERLLVHYLSDWIRNCDVSQPGTCPLAWNSYAIATRIAWWIRCLLGFDDGFRQRNGEFIQQMLFNLWNQAVYLHSHIEWDLRANHLLRDAVGLAWAGRFFSRPHSGGPDVVRRANHWLQTATRIAVGQAREQVLSDGGHFERSPMYHLEVMNDFFVLALLVEDPQVAALMRDTWQRMSDYIVWLRHPDGTIPQFNDAAASRANEYLRRGRHIRINVDLSPRRGGRHLRESGVVAWHGDRWTVFLDVGEIGPSYQPGHAHADTLTLECSYKGKRLFVDPGCLNYDDGESRRYDRSTAAHNTVCIDDTDSSEVWHIFRVGRPAKPRNVQVSMTDSSLEATASHSGYDHLPGRPHHVRTVTVDQDNRLTIVERLEGRQLHLAAGGFLLAPEWQAVPTNRGWLISDGNDQLVVTIDSCLPLQLSVEQRPFHPDYGAEAPAMRLQWSYKGTFPIEVRVQVRHSESHSGSGSDCQLVGRGTQRLSNTKPPRRITL